jgi:hypothetical protein
VQIASNALFRVRYVTPAVLFHKLFNKTVEILNRNHERQNLRPQSSPGTVCATNFFVFCFESARIRLLARKSDPLFRAHFRRTL